MVSKWHVNGFESGKVFISLQKCIFRIAKKQEQSQKLYHKIISQRQMTGMESGKVGKCLQKYNNRSAKKQGEFQKLCFKRLSK